MSSSSQNRAIYHPITPSSPPSVVGPHHPSSVININGNPIDAAFEAQIQKRGEQFEARLGGEKRINQLFPRCPPPTSTSSSAAKGKPKSKKNSNANGKKSGGTGKKKTVSNKQQQPPLNETSVRKDSISSSDPKVEIVDNIIDLSASGSNCDDVNRRNYIHHQQMISGNRHSLKTVLSPTTQEDVSLMVYNDNITQVNESSERNLHQTNSEATFNTNIKVQHSSYSQPHLHSEQPGYYQQQIQPQQEQQFSTNTPNKYIDSYLDDNAKAVSSTNTTLRDSDYHQATNYSHVIYQDSPPHVPSLESTNVTHNISTLNQLPSTEISATSGGSNRSYQGTFSSMSGGTSGSSVGGHLDSVSDHSNSFPPSVGPTATPSSVTSYSYSSSAMMMSPGSSTASSSEHSAGGGNGGLARGVVTGSNSNTRYIAGTVAAGNTPNIHGENSSAKDQNPDQIMTAVNAGRIRKNLSEYSVSGVDNRISAASSTSSNINQIPMDTSVLKDTKIEIAGRPFIFRYLMRGLYNIMILRLAIARNIKSI